MNSFEYKDFLYIEELEKEILFRICCSFKESLREFSTAIDSSFNFLEKIVLPIIITSKEGVTYNPFADIIEKYSQNILTHKFERDAYKLLPLGYSSDLNFEKDDHILSIEVKTANLNNPSDFSNTIAVGINQTSHIAKARAYGKDLPDPFFMYPTIPPFYKINDINKFVLTYGLIFIYPHYGDLLNEILPDFNSLFSYFKREVEKILYEIMINEIGIQEEKVKNFIKNKSSKSSKYTKSELLVFNIIRGILIHDFLKSNILKKLKIEDKTTINNFSKKLITFTKKIISKDIRPVAIIAISIPNGLLREKYIDKIVSGKNYSKSSRYHYENGIFEYLKEKENKTFPRVIFIDIKKEYLQDIKRYFRKINKIDYKIEEI